MPQFSTICRSVPGSMAIALIVKSVLMLGIFSMLRSYHDPLYSNPQCGLRLVNETDPAAYALHPFWKDLTYDDSCEGDSLQKYISSQSSKVESILQVCLTVTWTFLGLMATLWIVTTRVLFSQDILDIIRSVPGGIATILFSFMAGTILLMHSHYEQDVTFMTGKIQCKERCLCILVEV